MQNSQTLLSVTNVAGVPLASVNEVLDRAVLELMASGIAATTRRTYMAGLRYWVAWYRLRSASLPWMDGPGLPATLRAIQQFIIDHCLRYLADENGGLSEQLAYALPEDVDRELVDRGLKQNLGYLSYANVRQRLIGLQYVHRLMGLDDSDLRSHEVRALLRAVLRIENESDAIRQMRAEEDDKKDVNQRGRLRPLCYSEMKAMLATCDDSLVGLRDRALLMVGWASGGRRRSEICWLSVEDLRPHPRGYEFLLTHSKTNQDGRHTGAPKPIYDENAKALDRWLKAANITSGRIFRSLHQGRIGSSISGDGIRRIIRRRVELAGLEGRFSTHSLRIGWVTEAGRRSLPIDQGMDLTGHRSVQTYLHYKRATDTARNPGANLLDDDGME